MRKEVRKDGTQNAREFLIDQGFSPVLSSLESGVPNIYAYYKDGGILMKVEFTKLGHLVVKWRKAGTWESTVIYHSDMELIMAVMRMKEEIDKS